MTTGIHSIRITAVDAGNHRNRRIYVDAGVSRFKSPVHIYTDGLLVVEHDNFHATWRGDLLRLTRKEFLIFSHLVQNSERFVPSEQLWRIGWEQGRSFNSMNLRTHIHRLRSLIEPLGMKIENVVRVGYRFVPYAKCKSIK